ncbi:MAG: ATP-binding cassette domain-containing protein [Sphingomonadaceae bacterium]|nr:ATP-binding cassette domain-containing protein [Sphingomonadaceae bacterium]
MTLQIDELEIIFDRSLFSSFSMRIAPGEIVSIIGKSGVGKTSILNAIMGLLPPGSHSGVIDRPERVAVAFQDDRLFPWCDSLGRVDKRDSHLPRVLIQDCFLRSSHGSWRLVGCGVGTDRASVAA